MGCVVLELQEPKKGGVGWCLRGRAAAPLRSVRGDRNSYSPLFLISSLFLFSFTSLLFFLFLSHLFSFSLLIRFPVRKSTSPVLDSFTVLCIFCFQLVCCPGTDSTNCAGIRSYTIRCSLPFFFSWSQCTHNSCMRVGSQLHSDLILHHSAIVRKKIIASW